MVNFLSIFGQVYYYCHSATLEHFYNGLNKGSFDKDPRCFVEYNSTLNLTSFLHQQTVRAKYYTVEIWLSD